MPNKTEYIVTLHFQFPAWDETDGIQFREIFAESKAKANAIARRRAERDGHIAGGKGRVSFSAVEVRAAQPD